MISVSRLLQALHLGVLRGAVTPSGLFHLGVCRFGTCSFD